MSAVNPEFNGAIQRFLQGEDGQQSITSLEPPLLPQLNHSLLKHIISLAPTREELRQGPIDEEFGGYSFHLENPTRLGSHNHVVLAYIYGPTAEASASMVLKKGDALDQARGYLELIQFHPFIGEHMAPIYGTIDGWVVVGRLIGLSYEEVEDRMRNNPLFVNKYAEDVFALFDKVVEAGLRINDVSFQDGHNIFYNDEYRRIYFMEHKAIQPAVQQTQPLEVLFKLLDGEVSKAIPSQGGGEYPRPERLMFAFRLMQLAFAAHDPSLYYFRPIMLRVDHPEFRRAYEEQFLMDRDHVPMTDEEYSDLLAHPHGANGREILMPSSFVSPFLGGRMRSNGAVHGFSNEFIQAVLEGDFERFSNLVLARDFVIPLNEQDPRSFPNILKS